MCLVTRWAHFIFQVDNIIFFSLVQSLINIFPAQEIRKIQTRKVKALKETKEEKMEEIKKKKEKAEAARQNAIEKVFG